MADLSIRKALPEDAEQIAPLLVAAQLFQKEKLEGEKIHEPEAFRQELLKNVRTYLGQADKAYFVACDPAGAIVGYSFALLDTVFGKRGCLGDLFVLDAHRGQGLAKRLAESAIGWMKDRGMTSIVLSVHSKNVAALSVYTKLGFTEKPDKYLLLSKEI